MSWMSWYQLQTCILWVSNVTIPIKECPCLVSNRRQFIWLDDRCPITILVDEWCIYVESGGVKKKQMQKHLTWREETGET